MYDNKERILNKARLCMENNSNLFKLVTPDAEGKDITYVVAVYGIVAFKHTPTLI